MQRERIDVTAERADDEGNALAIRLAMKATSRLSRSSLATATSHLAFLAAFSAALSCGRRSSASAPLPVSISVNSAVDLEAFGLGERLDSSALAFEAEAGTALLLGRDAIVGDQR